MAYNISETEEKPQKESFFKKFKWKVPSIVGKFGLSVMAGSREYFLGLAVAEVEIEKIIKKRKASVIAPQKAKVTTWSF